MILRIVAIVVAVGFVLSSRGVVFSAADTNEVARELCHAIESTEVDCLGTNVIPCVHFNMSDLLSMETLPGWSTNDNERALLQYAASVSERRVGLNSEEDRLMAQIYFQFCIEQNWTNVLSLAWNMVRGEQCKLLVSDALNLILELDKPSMEMNSLLEGYGMSRHLADRHVVSEIYETYAKKLMVLDFDANRTVVTNAACMLYKTRTYFTTHEAVDRLLMRCFPTYETSSNRLAYAMLAMSPPSEITFHLSAAYFAPITNRLLSIQGPLPEVDELR